MKNNFKFLVRDYLYTGNEENFNVGLWELCPRYAPFIKCDVIGFLRGLRENMLKFDRWGQIAILPGMVMVEVFDAKPV